jgi:broad specificity phosphatase PhoE
MPRLYLVRHAEPAALWGAHPDPGLSELGHSQAAQVAARLITLSATHLITSPLARCQETAKPTEERLSQKASINRAVAEIPVPQSVKDHRTWLTTLMSGAWSDSHVEDQIKAWRAGVADALLTLTEDTIVFSHFVAINAAVSTAMSRDDVTVFKPGHASITILDAVDGALRVVELGQESAIHLA